MDEAEFYIVPSMSEQNTYFLFRDIGIEIKFNTLNNKITILSNGFLLPREMLFVQNNYLRNLV